MEFAARQIGPALERALSFEQERMASLFDAETGLPNEKYLERVLAFGDLLLPGQRAEARRPAALRGRGARTGGRACRATRAAQGSPSRLLRLATTCRTAVRVTDLVFRTGEDEVAVLMTDSTPEAMATVARRVTEAMRDETRERGNTSIESAFALFPDHAADPADLPRAARARRVRCAWF